MAEQLRKDAANADDATLKGTVNDLAAQVEFLGKQLTDLTGLQNVDTTELDKLAEKMGNAVRCHSEPRRSTAVWRTATSLG